MMVTLLVLCKHKYNSLKIQFDYHDFVYSFIPKKFLEVLKIFKSIWSLENWSFISSDDPSYIF